MIAREGPGSGIVGARGRGPWEGRGGLSLSEVRESYQGENGSSLGGWLNRPKLREEGETLVRSTRLPQQHPARGERLV